MPLSLEMKDSPKVSIIVSNYNTSDLVNGALESIVLTAGDVAYDVMIIDDASTDGGLTRIDGKYKQDRRFTFVQNERNVGFPAMNIARDRMHGTYLMMLDSDARLVSGALRTLLTFMEAHPDAGAATANLHNADGSVQHYYRRLMTPTLGFYTTVLGRFIDKYLLGLRHYKFYHYDHLDTTHDVALEQVPTACLIMRREALGSRIVDPDFHLFVDVDLCHRLYDRGYKVYLVAEALAIHLKSRSFGKRESVWRRREYYRSIGIYFEKHYPLWAPVMRIMLWLDRLMRSCMWHTIGREPIR